MMVFSAQLDKSANYNARGKYGQSLDNNRLVYTAYFLALLSVS